MRKREKDKKKRKKLRILLLVIVLFFPIIGSSEEGVVCFLPSNSLLL